MAIYHLSAKTGTRAGGQSAAAKYDYIARRGDYSRQPDKLVHLLSDNMPAWAQRKPSAYWRAADLHERANGRLFKELDVALPNELDHGQRIELAEAFVRHIATVSTGLLPFTLALHEGARQDREAPDNPHLHVAISERINDGHARSPEGWFKRAAVGEKKTAADGGAPKTDELKPKEWLENTRALWAEMCNRALIAAGHDARIDHRSLEDQGVDRAPQVHLGPKAFGYERRTGEVSRRRVEAERRQADERAAAQAVKKLIAEAEAAAAAERKDALRLRDVAIELERSLPESASAWQESPHGFDLADALLFPDSRSSAGQYRAKALPSGVVLHLRMPADRVAFVERSDRIRMSSTDALKPESVAEALGVGCAKWGRLSVTGSAAFRRVAVEQAVRLGVLAQLEGLTAEDHRYAKKLAAKLG